MRNPTYSPKDRNKKAKECKYPNKYPKKNKKRVSFRHPQVTFILSIDLLQIARRHATDAFGSCYQ